ncbi:MAG TPA: hypothetical protein VER12_05275 [Polyangiaceae bacterium]|nr:hypothetical protein [Polyangiaceae bacterium]
MALVIPITRYRSVSHRDLPLGLPKGDSDLLPISVFLWLCSVLRVALTWVHGRVFGVEASLALLFVLALPLYLLRARHARDTAPQ